MSRAKKIIILRHGCKEPANRTFNRMRICAFGLETGRQVKDLAHAEQYLFLRTLHSLFVSLLVRAVRSRGVIWSASANVIPLPPTPDTPEKFKKIFETELTLYFSGWQFRNPIGLEKYRAQLTAAFAPKKNAERKAVALLSEFKNKTLIGIHLRQLPYRYFKDGEFLITPARMCNIIDEYLQEHGLSTQNAALIVISDRPLSAKDFDGFTVLIPAQDEPTSLSLLSKCSVVMGTNAPFPNLAAWFGNIPHIVASDEPIDWNYYRNKKTYFENKYATFAVGSHL